MKKCFLISFISILVSCSFRSERKLEINQRIKELEQRIEQRSVQESADKQWLNSVTQHYQDQVAEKQMSNPDSVISFFRTIKPVSEHLGELQRQDLADKAEINKLIAERSRL